MHVVYLEPVPEDVAAIQRECLPEEFTLRVRKSDERPEDVVADADFVLVATTKVTPSVLDAAVKLKHIQHQGVGYNNIDLAAAKAKGVTSSGIQRLQPGDSHSGTHGAWLHARIIQVSEGSTAAA